MNTSQRPAVFNYKAQRLLLGLIALLLPLVVIFLSSDELSSISASYHTDARDAFVGLLFIVGALMWTYRGHTAIQGTTSKIAALAAVAVALFPTACDNCDSSLISTIHYVSAGVLFAVLAYFCLGPFRLNTKGKGGKRGLRSNIYLVCGWAIIICMLGLLISKMALSQEAMMEFNLTYWAETVSLLAFGTAWIVAGKFIPFLVDGDEALKF